LKLILQYSFLKERIRIFLGKRRKKKTAKWKWFQRPNAEYSFVKIRVRVGVLISTVYKYPFSLRHLYRISHALSCSLTTKNTKINHLKERDGRANLHHDQAWWRSERPCEFHSLLTFFFCFFGSFLFVKFHVGLLKLWICEWISWKLLVHVLVCGISKRFFFFLTGGCFWFYSVSF